ncbi:MAG: hypothetical protein P8Y91_08270 [Desulfuromonadales bacterium]|jgi:hypothetical protein
MTRTSALMSVCFCAGVLGALVNSLVAWKAGQLGLPARFDVRMAPDLSTSWLYGRMIWGGLWGLAYFLAVGSYKSRRHWARKGLWISLLPTLFQLFVVFPHFTGHGWMGLALGRLTPVFVLLYNLVWGFFTGVFCRILWGRT